MIDAFVIGAKLNLDDKIFEQMNALVESFTRTQQMVDRINKTLREMGGSARTAADGVRSLARAWESVATATARAAGAADRMNAARPGAPGWTSDRAIDRAAPLMIGGGGRRTGSPDEPFYAPVPIDGRRGVYDRSRSNFGFGGGGGDEPPGIPLGGFYGGGRGRRGERDYANDLFVGGIVASTVAGAARYAWGQTATPEHIRAQMLLQGLSPKITDRMMSEARRIQQGTPGISYSDAAEALKDAFVITRSPREAMAIAPTLAQDAVVLHAANDTPGIAALFNALASGEMRGLLNKKLPNGDIDPRPVERYLDLATRISVATGGRFSPADFKRLGSNAGPEFRMMNNTALVDAAVLSMGLGAGKAGTGINAMGLEFIGGHVNKAVMHILSNMGLVDPKGALYMGMGRYLLRPGSLKDDALFRKNPFEWIEDVMMPSIHKMYPKAWAAATKINASDVSPNDKLAALYQLFNRIPGGRLAAEMMYSLPIIQKYEAAVTKTPGPKKAIGILAKNDPLNSLDQMTAAVGAMVAEFSKPGVADAVAAMHAIAGGANDLANWGSRHQGAAHLLDYGALGIGAWGTVRAGRAGAHMLGEMFGGKGGAADDFEKAAERAIRDLKRRGGAAAEGAEAGAEGGPLGLIAGAVAGAVGDALLDHLRNAIKDAGGEFGEAIGHFLGMHDISVTVANGHDLAAGVTRQQAKTAARMPASSVAPNVHLNPPMPGWAAAGVVNP